MLVMSAMDESKELSMAWKACIQHGVLISTPQMHAAATPNIILVAQQPSCMPPLPHLLVVQQRMPAVEAVSSMLGCSSRADKLLLAALVGCLGDSGRWNFEPTATGKPGQLNSWWAAGGAGGKESVRALLLLARCLVGKAPKTAGPLSRHSWNSTFVRDGVLGV